MTWHSSPTYQRMYTSSPVRGPWHTHTQPLEVGSSAGHRLQSHLQEPGTEASHNCSHAQRSWGRVHAVGLSRACQGLVKDLSRACQGPCQGLAKGYVKGSSRACQGLVQGSVKGLSRACQGFAHRPSRFRCRTAAGASDATTAPQQNSPRGSATSPTGPPPKRL